MMAKRFIQINMFIALIISNVIAISQTASPKPPTETETTTPSDDTGDTAEPLIERFIPDVKANQMAHLRSQYPKNDIRKLVANGEEFTALWRKDQSGDAFGAVLILPADGQTANWPNTIDVLRNNLPKNGWSTLAIDIQQMASLSIPARENPNDDVPINQDTDNNAPIEKSMGDKALMQAPKNDNMAMQENKENPKTDNHARIRSAIAFLHEQGQYNIILAGYGNSVIRIFEYTKDKPAPQTNLSEKKEFPVRALIMINPLNYTSGSLVPELEAFQYKEMPILDIVFGTHYLDTEDATKRQSEARAQKFEKYIQLKIMEPSTTVFSNENRLSRRVRGFLNKYAKGVEIDRR